MNTGKILRFLLLVCFFTISAVALFVLTIALTDYKPEKEIVLTNMPKTATLNLDTIEILTWNIGYAGLGCEMDFFYDGGVKTRTDKETTVKNLEAITSFLQDNSADFVFLQEVDKNAARSYNIDMLSTIAAKKPLYTVFYGKNYDVLFVPLPLRSPMGRVESGILTLSRFVPSQSVRYAYPNEQSFPKKLFLLDRCFLMCRYPLKNGKQLVLINTHNSAFDNAGEQRRKEMSALKDFVMTEYQNGNYVIAGGDWNQTPPTESAKPYHNVSSEYFAPLRITADFMPPTWQWVSDGNATDRFLDRPYIKGKTKETILDFFLISPNIEIIHSETINNNYQHSDHNPVTGKFRLK